MHESVCLCLLPVDGPAMLDKLEAELEAERLAMEKYKTELSPGQGVDWDLQKLQVFAILRLLPLAFASICLRHGSHAGDRSSAGWSSCHFNIHASAPGPATNVELGASSMFSCCWLCRISSTIFPLWMGMQLSSCGSISASLLCCMIKWHKRNLRIEYPIPPCFCRSCEIELENFEERPKRSQTLMWLLSVMFAMCVVSPVLMRNSSLLTVTTLHEAASRLLELRSCYFTF